MKIILSHDVDHLHWKHHYFRDLTLQKHVARHSLSWLRKKIPFSVWKERMKVRGVYNNLAELLDFYDSYQIKANFFFGMDQALGLVYTPQEATPWINKIMEHGHQAGVHGIEYANPDNIKKEYQSFQSVSGLNTFGIRTHYLRMNGYTLERFAEQGYQYDSTVQGILHPFKIGSMWEIPMSLMDASLLPDAQSNLHLNTWKKASRLRIDQALDLQIPYFVVNLHDIYFHQKQFPVIFDWFHWLIDEFCLQNFEFISFHQAVTELEKSSG